MQITLQNAGKRFNRDWIFRQLNYSFESGKAYAITGSNGSGKSTLLQCIAGSYSLHEGSIDWQQYNKDNVYSAISICAPNLELIEEMTGEEFLQFHFQFKSLTHSYRIPDILAEVNLISAATKQIRYYSSGMKQRLKLAQAIFSDTPILLLDEPCTNLDKEGYAVYNQMIEHHTAHKIVIVCSNEEAEIGFCNDRINLSDYK
ncbi:MAG: ATP-binding cassette domain-containing protein [Chitinophagaceae bacterium]|nr:ATP-binding cassette domain-containing protein [Chitinophagaceae bacterium]